VNRYKDLAACQQRPGDQHAKALGQADATTGGAIPIVGRGGPLVLRKQEMLASIPAVQPIPNEDLTQTAGGFGMRIHPIHKIEKFHAGMDFTAKGTPSMPRAMARVTFADYATNGYGTHVVVDHGFDYETLYAHLSELKVRNGQRVKRGDVIGLVGNTGLSAGPHLHYEVHKNGEAVDP
jgi:murein DD-endopeptidase MepM/ murein hydrolase activator NlpD